jgi:GT2 family glycosyltransferase
MFIIIPAFRAPEKLRACLDALRHQTLAPSHLLVHDNSAQNIGFTAAVNLGIAKALHSGSEFALILNQDVRLLQNALAGLEHFMQEHPLCALAGIKLLSTHEPDCICHGGCKEAFPAGVHITGRRSRGDCAVSAEMPWVSGAALCVRLQAIADIGLMDPHYFLFGSDSDWCYSARLRGWQVWYCAEAEGFHDGGISADPAAQKEFQAQIKKDLTYWRDKWTHTEFFGWLQHGGPRPGFVPELQL